MSKTYSTKELELLNKQELVDLVFKLQDKASLWDTMFERGTYVSYYTGHDGQGGVLKERYFSSRAHHDGILEREAEKKGRKLGACSYVQFKPIGMPVNIYYGQHGEDSRLDFLEISSE